MGLMITLIGLGWLLEVVLKKLRSIKLIYVETEVLPRDRTTDRPILSTNPFPNTATSYG